jgi:predicted nucleic acid-binding protein
VIVLDASVVVELLLATPRAALVRTRIAGPDESLHAPHLLNVEVAQVLRRSIWPAISGRNGLEKNWLTLSICL